MRRDDDELLTDAQHNEDRRRFKMKAKTALVLVMIISFCGLIFSITDAYPTPETETSQEDNKITNSSRLVITHVVKTIEFEVGLVDDDGKVDENSTDSDATGFYETDIQVLNVDLLREVVNQATGDDNWEATNNSKQPSPQTTTEREKNTEGDTQHLLNGQFNQPSNS